MPAQLYTPETYHADTSIGYLLKRAHALLVDQVEPVVSRSGLTFTQWVVLMHLREGMAINASVLCAQLRHDSGALTRIIDQLEARELVSRQRSRRDRRSVQLQLTARGEATVEALVPAVVEQLNVVLSPLSEADLQDLCRLLRKLTASSEQTGQGGAAAALPQAGELA